MYDDRADSYTALLGKAFGDSVKYTFWALYYWAAGSASGFTGFLLCGLSWVFWGVVAATWAQGGLYLVLLVWGCLFVGRIGHHLQQKLYGHHLQQKLYPSLLHLLVAALGESIQYTFWALLYGTPGSASGFIGFLLEFLLGGLRMAFWGVVVATWAQGGLYLVLLVWGCWFVGLVGYKGTRY